MDPDGTTITVHNIAKWNLPGKFWSRLGIDDNNGTTKPYNPTNTPPDCQIGDVYALAVYDNDLIVGGAFDCVGGPCESNASVKASRIAKWNGTTWSTLSGAVSPGNVRDGIVFDDPDPYPGAGTVVDTVFSLVTYKRDLIVGGSFYELRSPAQSPPVFARNIAKWNNSGGWSRLGLDGLFVNNLDNGGTQGLVLALTIWNRKLIAGGIFDSANGAVTPAKNVAKWNGGAWSALGAGVDDGVFALTEFQGDLIAGGENDLVPANYIAKWNGGPNWTTLGSPNDGSNGFVNALAVFNCDLIVGGTFETINIGPGPSIKSPNWARYGPCP